MLTHYRTRFDLFNGSDPADPVRVLDVCRRWVSQTEEAPVPDDAPQVLFVSGSRVAAASGKDGSDQVKALRYQRRVGATDWITELGIRSSGAATRVYVSLSSAARTAVQRRQRSWPPGVVALLLKQFDGTAHMPLSASPVAALERGDVAALVEMLRNQRRSLPVVVVSVDTFSERPLVNADDLQKRLLGLAQVVVLGKRAGFAFRDELGSVLQDEPLARRWGVFGGAVRLYWPGLKLERGENPFQHRLWVPDSGALDAAVVDALFDDLSWASVHGDVPDWVDSALIQRISDRKAFDELRAASADLSLYEQYFAALERDLEAERAHRAEAVERATSAEGELESLRYHLREANAALTTLRQRAREEHADAAVDGAWTVATFRLGGQGARDCIEEGIPAEERAEVEDAMQWLADPESWANPAGKLSNLGGGVYEYRVNVKDHWNRLFIARLPRIHTVVVLHAYSKKSNELDPGELKVANERLKQLSTR